jgi:hypothetical protein
VWKSCSIGTPLTAWPGSLGGISTCGSIRRTIRGAEVIDFLDHLLRHLPGRLLIVRDGPPAHRGHPVKEFIAAQRGRLAVKQLPAYAQSCGVHLGLLEVITNCPTSALKISSNSVITRAVPWVACGGVHRWSAPSGIRRICHYDMQASIEGSPLVPV